MSQENEKNKLILIINGIEHEWKQQYITGVEIRNLGSIQADSEVYLKIKEPWEDELIAENTKVDLARPGLEHFFSIAAAKEIELIVNGRVKKWDKKEISFREVVELAYGAYTDLPTMVYTVAYEDGPVKNPEGSMVRGSVVFVKNKMIFHATATDKS